MGIWELIVVAIGVSMDAFPLPFVRDFACSDWKRSTWL